ncbi:MAG: ABC transporter substrate-binding protein [Devosia sp.]
MTFRLGRRGFLAGSSALLGASALPTMAWAQEALRLYWWGGQTRADRTLAVADLWAKAKGAAVPTGEFGSFADHWPKLATMVAGGNAPDVYQMDYRFIVEYASRGALEPLDAFVESGALNLSDFDQDQIDGGKVDGKLYGISLGANTVAALYSQTAFEEAGVTPPTLGWSYEDVPELGEAFLAANIRGGMKLMMDGSSSEPALDNWIRQRGKPLYTPEGNLGPDVDDMVAWFQMWNDFREKGYTPTGEDSALDLDTPETSMLVLNKAAVAFSNSNQLIVHQSVNPDKLGMLNYPRISPTTGGGHYRKPSQLWSMASTSGQKDLSADFISFFVNDIEAGKILQVERGIPCSAAVRDAIAPLLDEQNKISLDFVSSLGDLLGPLPASPPNAAGEIDQSLLDVLADEVAFGARTPEDAGQFFVTEATALLERAKAA